VFALQKENDLLFIVDFMTNPVLIVSTFHFDHAILTRGLLGLYELFNLSNKTDSVISSQYLAVFYVAVPPARLTLSLICPGCPHNQAKA